MLEPLAWQVGSIKCVHFIWRYMLIGGISTEDNNSWWILIAGTGCVSDKYFQMEHLHALFWEIKKCARPSSYCRLCLIFVACYIFPHAKCFPSIKKPLTHRALYCFLMRHSDSGKVIPLASADVRPATSITVKNPLCPKTTFLVPKIWTLLTGADITVRGSLCTQWTMVPVPSPNSAANSATDWCGAN